MNDSYLLIYHICLKSICHIACVTSNENYIALSLEHSTSEILSFCSCYILYYILYPLQKQPPEVFYRKAVLKNFAKFTGTHLCQSLFFNKVADLRTATLLQKRLWHRCFPVNFAKFLRKPFSQNTSGRLLRPLERVRRRL